MDEPPVASTSALPTVPPVRRDLSRLLLHPTNTTPSPLSGTRDLITEFHLDSLYNTFLRPYLPPATANAPPSSLAPATADSPAPPAVKGAVSIKGKERAVPAPAPRVDSPAPYAVASPAPPGGGGGGGFKITLGGIKLNSSAGGGVGIAPVAAGAAATTSSGKVKRVKMEKNYSHMVQDILGRNSIKKDQYLSHLVMNPDPPPCPPLVRPDAQLLRDGLTLKVGGLAGFDMSMWENPPPGDASAAGFGGDERKKKKKRKHLQDAGPGGAGGDGGGGGSERKKQRHA
ncbi:hypothetical protein JCM11491_005696 [Sporobolomyces phaffii]